MTRRSQDTLRTLRGRPEALHIVEVVAQVVDLSGRDRCTTFAPGCDHRPKGLLSPAGPGRGEVKPPARQPALLKSTWNWE